MTYFDLLWPSITFYHLLRPLWPSMIKGLLSRPGLFSGPVKPKPKLIQSQVWISHYFATDNHFLIRGHMNSHWTPRLVHIVSESRLFLYLNCFFFHFYRSHFNAHFHDQTIKRRVLKSKGQFNESTIFCFIVSPSKKTSQNLPPSPNVWIRKSLKPVSM